MGKMTEEKTQKNSKNISKDCGTNYRKYNTCIPVIPEGEEREKGTEEIFETMIENIPQVNIRHQTTDPGSSEYTK